jgi:IS1 family transposase
MSPQGTPITRQIEVWLGDPRSAYVYFDPEFSQTFQTKSTLQENGSTPQDPELLPLEFHNDTRHFARSMYIHLEVISLGIKQLLLRIILPST